MHRIQSGGAGSFSRSTASSTLDYHPNRRIRAACSETLAHQHARIPRRSHMAVVVPGNGEIGHKVAQLLDEMSLREIAILHSGSDVW
jgi:hypothetical protein